MKRPPSVRRRPLRLPLLLAVAALLAALSPNPSPVRAAEASGNPADEPPLPDPAAAVRAERDLARGLARLDERLELGSSPDGTGRWVQRLAAVAEHRRSVPGSGPDPAPDLLRHLAAQLRGLGVERDLEPPPRAASEPPDGERAARVQSILGTVHLLHRKLDRLEGSERVSVRGAVTRLTAGAVPGNDSCAAALTLTDETVTGSTSGANSDGSASCGISGSSPDAWYRYAATQDGLVDFYTLGSGYDTVLSLHDACPADGGVELACDDDSAGTLGSALALEMTAGQEVWVRVSGFAGDAGDFELSASAGRSISGSVTLSDTAAPVAGAAVDLYVAFDSYFFDHLDGTSTGADGSYRFGRLADGTYAVKVSGVDGYLYEFYDDVKQNPIYGPSPEDGHPIAMTGGAPVQGIDFALDPAGEIRGTVTDATTGEPLRGEVTVYSHRGSYIVNQVVGGDGTYSVRGLPVGDYVLEGQSSEHRSEVYDDLPCSRHRCPITSGTLVPVVDTTPVSGIDFALDRLGAVSGTVRNGGSGAPVTAGAVRLYDESGLVSGGVGYLDSDGGFRITGVEPGTWVALTVLNDYLNEMWDDIPCLQSCDLATGTPVTVEPGTETEGIDFVVDRYGTIRGTVTHSLSGVPISYARVVAIDSSGVIQDTATTASSTGAYTLSRLPAGTYTVRAEDDDYAVELYDDVPCHAGCTETDATYLTVSLNSTLDGVNFALDRLGVISGTVERQTDGFRLYGDVLALLPDGSVAGSGWIYRHSYTIRGLPPGVYRVRTDIADYYGTPGQDELYDDVPCEPTCDLAAGTALALDLNGAAYGVDFALTPCPAASESDLVGTVFLSTESAEACEVLSAHSGTTVGTGADVTFRSGRRIVLGDGFSVQDGASFRAVIEPDWGHP